MDGFPGKIYDHKEAPKLQENDSVIVRSGCDFYAVIVRSEIREGDTITGYNGMWYKVPTKGKLYCQPSGEEFGVHKEKSFPVEDIVSVLTEEYQYLSAQNVVVSPSKRGFYYFPEVATHRLFLDQKTDQEREELKKPQSFATGQFYKSGSGKAGVWDLTICLQAYRTRSKFPNRDIDHPFLEKLEGQDAGLYMEHDNVKGRCVFAAKTFEKNEFVCEYHGNLVSREKGDELFKKYGEEKGSYLYYFGCDNKEWCIDATCENTGGLGRLINHSRRNPNVRAVAKVFSGIPRLYFVAKKKIEAGNEILYDYGDKSKESVETFDWLKNS